MSAGEVWLLTFGYLAAFAFGVVELFLWADRRER